MRLVSALMWTIGAAFSFFLTMGNVALVDFQQRSQTDLRDLDIHQDLYDSSVLAGPTRWTSACLSEGLSIRKELQLKQLDLMYGHEPLAQINGKLVQTQAFLRDYLRCKPTDGTAWLASAMVSNTIDNDSDLTMQYLALSKFFTPNSESAKKVRAAILANVSGRLKANYQDMFIEATPSP